MMLAMGLTIAAATAHAQTPAAPPAETPPAPTAPAPAPSSPPAAATAPAKPARHRVTVNEHFAAANTSKDGHLTLDQAKDNKWRYVISHFEAIDTAKQGYITLDQLHAFIRGQRAARAAAKKPAASPTQN